MRALRAGAAAALGLVAGAAAMLGLQPTPASVVPAPPPSSLPPATAPVTPPPPEASDQVALVWTPGGLPAGLDVAVAALPRVAAVTVVRGGLVELAAATDAEGRPTAIGGPGAVIPLDALAFDPGTYPAFVPKSASGIFSTLTGDEVLLGATAAQLRGLGAGARVRLHDGRERAVTAVVDDALVAAAEVVLAYPGPPELVPRYLLVRYRGDRAAFEQSVRAALAEPTPVRIRGPGETPYLRHGDAVLPMAAVKQRFGEFAYRRGQAGRLEQDASWRRANLVTVDVPLLGTVTCHRAIVGALEEALGRVRDQSLGWLLEAGGYAGCYNPRLTRSGDSVSRHAWGIALDINTGKNRYGEAGAQDRRLVDAFAAAGFTWGGEWLIPDPAHFEYARP